MKFVQSVLLLASASSSWNEVFVLMVHHKREFNERNFLRESVEISVPLLRGVLTWNTADLSRFLKQRESERYVITPYEGVQVPSSLQPCNHEQLTPNGELSPRLML
eukprot:gb/GECG01013482.1/.p1 GENE.gb/GECG01013482.1/~~gb/GECG01013482.1/.p1  ORF type:complete len:106 (+),score=7.53 gb/GECG01013482.1/:1-318(+)